MTELIQEYVASHSEHLRHDGEAHVLRGVKLLGLASRNGRRYREEARRGAMGLYEGAKVNVNHPKGDPLAPRDYQDRLGVVRNVMLRPGEGLFGDLHYNPAHALAEQLRWDADHSPESVGLSHNVVARLSREGEEVLVEEITHVQSVDLVADPATTNGLFEATPAAAAPSTDIAAGQGAEALIREYQQRLAALDLREATAQRRAQIAQLLARYELPPASDTAAGGDRILSPLFVRLLESADSAQAIEELVRDRAALVAAAAERTAFARFRRSRAQSRDQQLGGATQRSATVAEFVAAITSR